MVAISVGRIFLSDRLYGAGTSHYVNFSRYSFLPKKSIFRFYIFPGAEIPKMANPFARTVLVASQSASRALVSDLSSVTTR